jgi:hypothetical protein
VISLTAGQSLLPVISQYKTKREETILACPLRVQLAVRHASEVLKVATGFGMVAVLIKIGHTLMFNPAANAIVLCLK